MYDNYISKSKYSGLKSYVFEIINGDDTTGNIEEFAESVHRPYVDGAISSSRYDNLMHYLDDMSL